MKGHHPSCHVPVGATDKSRHTNHDWTSVYGPNDYDYSPEDPLIPVDPTYCPATPEYRPPSSPYRSASPAYCPASPIYPPASSTYAPTSPNYRPVSPTFSSFGKLGYNGRFHTPCPDHVVLESSDEYEFYISRAALVQASGFFKDMFELPAPPDDPPLAIPTFVLAQDLYILLSIVEDQKDDSDWIQLAHLGQTVDIPLVIQQLTLVEKITLQNLADRFDCEDMGACVKLSLKVFYDTLTGNQLLAAASKVESITVARVAIIKMGREREWRYKGSCHDWWTRIGDIRPSWQVALTRLVWELQNELINPEQERGRRSNGMRLPRSRETIMAQTTMSPEAIAAAFDPPKASITIMRIDSS